MSDDALEDVSVAGVRHHPAKDVRLKREEKAAPVMRDNAYSARGATSENPKHYGWHL